MNAVVRVALGVAIAAVVAVVVLACAPPASAHAELSTPTPTRARCSRRRRTSSGSRSTSRSEGVPDGVQVFDAEGEPIASSSRTRDTDLLVTLDEEVGDGHRGGRLAGGVGRRAPDRRHAELLGRGAERDAWTRRSSTRPSDGVPVALSLSRWPAYAGLLLAVGLVWFATLLLPAGLDRLDRAWRRLRRVGAPRRGGRGGGLAGRAPADGALPARHRAAHAAGRRHVALAAGRGGRHHRRHGGGRAGRRLAVAPATGPGRAGTCSRPLAGLLALAPLPLSGHTRAETETELVVSRRLAAPGRRRVWLGGLVGLALTLPGLAGRREAAAALRQPVLDRGGLASSPRSCSPAAFLAWRIVGSWDALVNDGYGQLLLVKIGVAAFAVAIAAYNRFRLLPRMQRRRPGSTTGSPPLGALSRTTARRGVAAGGGAAGDRVPDPEEPAHRGPRRRRPFRVPQTERAGLGDLEAVVTISPATSGMNTLTLRVRDADGDRPRARSCRACGSPATTSRATYRLPGSSPGTFRGTRGHPSRRHLAGPGLAPAEQVRQPRRQRGVPGGRDAQQP